MLAILALALLAQAQPGDLPLQPLPKAPAAAIDPQATPRAETPKAEPLADRSRLAAHDAMQLPPSEFSLAQRTNLDAQMREYFAGEKREAWAWVGAGVTAIVVGGGLHAESSNVAEGASYPLLDISVVQFGAALYLFWRSGDETARLSDQIANHPCAFFAEEPARMRRVVRSKSVYLPVEALTLVGGAAMAGVGATGHHDFLQGAGWGLIAQSLTLLVFDQFATARAQTYDRELTEAKAQHANACPLP